MIRVHKTGHQIADTVADAIIASGIPDLNIDLDIVYGILRHDVFSKSKLWVNIDRGYWGANHFDGNYRVSLMGTQQTNFWPEPSQHTMPLHPWRGFDHSKPVLVCPVTPVVKKFFNSDDWDGSSYGKPENYIYNYVETKEFGRQKAVVRLKGDPSPINFQDYNYVLTFNSSVGWQAIAAGIPCVSDTTHSMVGSFFKNISLAELSKKQYIERARMFGCMESLQLTLQEMREGKLWPLIEKLISMWVMTAEKPLPLMSASTPLSEEPSQKLTFNI